MPKSTKSTKRDPIFAAIDRCLKADARFLRKAEEDDLRPKGAVRSKADVRSEADVRSKAAAAVCARRALAKTVPTTLEGLAAFARFLDHQSSSVLEGAFFDDDGEHLAFYASLNRSLSALTCGAFVR